MALSQSVLDSLDESESSLRNALAYAARQERPSVCNMISELLTGIDKLKTIDDVLDKLENRKPGDQGFFGISFGDDE